MLDLSRVLAGPLAGQMLADLGAEVIKVERPGVGDESRQYGPPFLNDARGPLATESAFYLSANRNKKSITLNLATTEGQALAAQLAAKSDVLLENFRVGALAKYGLDYKTLAAQNPRLIYCSITGYGQTGPYRQRPGYDAIFQAMGGLMSSIGFPDDQPNGGPLRTGPSIVDIITSLYADIAVLGALYGRDANGGRGEYIELALLDSSIAAMSHYAMFYLVSGRVPPRRGNGGNGGVPSQGFVCSDGAVMLTVGNDAQFRRFCEVLERPDLAADDRFAAGSDRIRNRDILIPILEAVFLQRPAKVWLERLVAADIAAGPINDLAAVFADPQVQERGMAVPVDHPSGAPLRLVGNPIHYAEAPIRDYAPPPAIGQHTKDILGGVLGLDAAAIERLARAGVI